MKSYKQMLLDNPFSLVIALPSNSLEMAEAALEGGVQAVKVHCNVWHRASGHSFGTFSENREFLRELVKLCGDVPVGLVPGADGVFCSPDEMKEMGDLGVSFISAYLSSAPVYIHNYKKPEKMLAVPHGYDEGLLQAVRASDIEVVESSIMSGDDYGKMLNCEDLLRYSHIASVTGKPCIIPTQKAIRPDEVRSLKDAGCKGIMIGAIVMGKEPTANEVRSCVRAYRTAIDQL